MTRFREAFSYIATEIIKNRDFLNQLDVIGDGDHGTNMSRGFKAALEALDESESENPQELLHLVGVAFAENIGGASGPLYATAFLRASSACTEDTKFNVSGVERLLQAAVHGIEKRGRVQCGAKTMLDVIYPVYQCFLPEQSADKTLYQCLQMAVKAAKEGVDYTATIPATKGRAAYIGERSIGHTDPGAMSSFIMVCALFDFLKL